MTEPYRDEYLEIQGYRNFSQRALWYEYDSWDKDLNATTDLLTSLDDRTQSRARAMAGASGVRKGTAAWDTKMAEAKGMYAMDIQANNDERRAFESSGLTTALRSQGYTGYQNRYNFRKNVKDRGTSDIYQSYEASKYSGWNESVRTGYKYVDVLAEEENTNTTPAYTQRVNTYTTVKHEAQGSMTDYYTMLYGTAADKTSTLHKEYLNTVEQYSDYVDPSLIEGSG